MLQLWGTDVELARRFPPARAAARPPRAIVVAASSSSQPRRELLGAREVRVIPNGVELPARVEPPEEPPHVLFVGRLSARRRGSSSSWRRRRGFPRVIAGDGPLRARVAESTGLAASGFVPPDLLGGWYERAAVVCVPSRREGYGVVAREAMAYGRPVVATAVGGLRDAVVDGETGLLVEAGDVAALRAALERLLADAPLRAELGANARRRAESAYSWPAATAAFVAAYEDVARRRGTRTIEG